MKKSKLILTLGLVFLLVFAFSSMNIKYSQEIVDPLYKDLTGRLYIKTANESIIRNISNEMIDGNLNKVNIPLSSINLNSFRKLSSLDKPISHFEDIRYVYTLHDGEDKVLIREKK